MILNVSCMLAQMKSEWTLFGGQCLVKFLPLYFPKCRYFSRVCVWSIPWRGPGPGPSPARRPPRLSLRSTAPGSPPLGSAGSGGRCGPASACGPPPAPSAPRTAYPPDPVAWWCPLCRQSRGRGWRGMRCIEDEGEMRKRQRDWIWVYSRWGVWLGHMNYPTLHACLSYHPEPRLTGTTWVN